MLTSGRKIGQRRPDGRRIDPPGVGQTWRLPSGGVVLVTAVQREQVRALYVGADGQPRRGDVIEVSIDFLEARCERLEAAAVVP